ncbi:MAG: methyltransferase domain-containing protein, partial [bacterium]|nr:methyltransferase domain-containing protein [bacterium]
MPLEQMFDLGNVPSVNSFPTVEQIPFEQPTRLEVCVCPRCFLVQLSTLLPSTDLFTEYRYVSAASQTWVRYLEELAATLAKRFGINGETGVLELGSNDGTLLAAVTPWTRRVLGVDPAKNLAPDAEARGVPTIAGFLTEAVAEQIVRERGQYDLVLGLNVVAHTPDLPILLRAIHRVLKPGGTFMMEAVYVLQTILRGAYDTVYHEHVYCFSLTALREQFE